MSTSTKPISKREEESKKAAKDLTKDAKHAEYIRYIFIGRDSNKKKKNDKECDRGQSSRASRYCSQHIRAIYPAHLLGDYNQTEFCVNGRTSNHPNNPCTLCPIDIHNHNGQRTQMINLWEAILAALRRHNDNNLLAGGAIPGDYPGTNNQCTSLRITVNGRLWTEDYLKLAPHSSILKITAPSGYKYKDRISVGRVIKRQGMNNRDLVFFMTKDPNYNDEEREAERPVVNCVGFWNLLEKAQRGDIRNIIHLNEGHVANVCFGFILLNPQNIDTIKVEFVTTRPSLDIKEEAVELWSYPALNAEEKESGAADHAHVPFGGLSMMHMNANQHNINGSPSSLYSTQSTSISHPTLPAVQSNNIHIPSHNVNNNHHSIQQPPSMNIMQPNPSIHSVHNNHQMQHYQPVSTTHTNHISSDNNNNNNIGSHSFFIPLPLTNNINVSDQTVPTQPALISQPQIQPLSRQQNQSHTHYDPPYDAPTTMDETSQPVQPIDDNDQDWNSLFNLLETPQPPNMATTPFDDIQSVISGYGGYHDNGLDVSLCRHSPYSPSMNDFIFNQI